MTMLDGKDPTYEEMMAWFDAMLKDESSEDNTNQ